MVLRKALDRIKMTTRWQAFRRHQQRRYNPLQQGLQLTGLVLLVCFYAWQPADRRLR